MKKVNLLLFCMLFSFITYAQHARMSNLSKSPVLETQSSIFPIIPASVSSSSAPPLSVIWSDDCSDTSTWVFTQTSTLTGPQYGWQHEMDPNAIPPNSNGPMLSATASNGYMFINSDAYGSPTQVDLDGTFMIAEFTNANPVDCSNYQFVQLKFSHNYRWWNDTRGVRVSGDNGATWTDFEITNQQGYPNDQNSLNPEIATYDISSIAGGQSQVLVQFYYNDNDYWAWYWAVDDVSIEEMPDNAITSSNEVIGGYWVDYLNYSASGNNIMIGLDYSQTPISQLTNHPFSFEGSIKNAGLSIQHAKLKYDVNGPVSAYGESNVIILNPGEDSVFAATPTFGDANTAIGNYTVSIWGEADSAGAGIVTTTTDMVTKSFEVTDHIYAKDLGEDTLWGNYLLAGMQDQNHLITRYEMYANENLYSLKVYIGSNTLINSEIKAIVYDIDTTATNDRIYNTESDSYVITANDIGGWIDIPFLNPVQLYNGYAYQVGVKGVQGPDSVYIGLTNNSMYNGEHSVFDELGLSTNSAGAPTWYYTTYCPMVRMNFEAPPNSVNENSSIFNIYPNPTNGIISIDLSQMLNCSIVVNNVLGQTVYTSTVTDLRNTIDLSSLEKGLYTVELRDNELLYSEKIILE